MRRIVASLIVIGLVVGIWLLWPDSTEDAPSGTDAVAPTTTNTTSPATTSTTSSPSTSTTDQTHLVTTVEEAETILRELWFGWFEGIYNQDEDRIRKVVASGHQFELAKDQFGKMAFDEEPQLKDISLTDTEILESTTECTAIWTRTSFDGFTSGHSNDVHVLRWKDGWKFFSLWALRNDLWEADCESSLD